MNAMLMPERRGRPGKRSLEAPGFSPRLQCTSSDVTQSSQAPLHVVIPHFPDLSSLPEQTAADLPPVRHADVVIPPGECGTVAAASPVLLDSPQLGEFISPTATCQPQSPWLDDYYYTTCAEMLLSGIPIGPAFPFPGLELPPGKRLRTASQESSWKFLHHPLPVERVMSAGNILQDPVAWAGEAGWAASVDSPISMDGRREEASQVSSQVDARQEHIPASVALRSHRSVNLASVPNWPWEETHELPSLTSAASRKDSPRQVLSDAFTELLMKKREEDMASGGGCFNVSTDCVNGPKGAIGFPGLEETSSYEGLSRLVDSLNDGDEDDYEHESADAGAHQNPVWTKTRLFGVNLN